ncbi:unnamed protein product [Cylicocyclus nassatus]|uniref:C-type lectin domain-containing protein n=1 Tax=Cylicocyclus nassatus TaxID=53992 RepID=A0AA36GW50_CYLNA|nr:unnamed protein product [Cylicocyclus nassatus]
MKFLLLALITLAEAFPYPNTRLDQPHSISYLAQKADVGRCDDGWAYYSETDACYKNFLRETFGDAERKCVAFGGHLASIHSERENSIVIEMAESGIRLTTTFSATWIGLVRSDYMNFSKSTTSNWTWTDGTEVDFLAWAPGEPTNYQGQGRCTMLYADPFEDDARTLHYQKWGDTKCSYNERSYVCKKKALH